MNCRIEGTRGMWAVWFWTFCVALLMLLLFSDSRWDGELVRVDFR